MSRTSPLGSKSLPILGAQPRRILELPLRFVGFWTAICVPFVLLGMFASGVAQDSPELLAALLAVNFVGLVVGRNYKR